MYIEINQPHFSEIVSIVTSFLFIFGHNLWLIAKKDSAKIRLEINTSDVFPASDSAVKPERVKDFRLVSANASAPIENYSAEETSLVAEVESGENFYGALELYAHPISLESVKFASYIKSEDAEEFVEPRFVAGETTVAQRESYAKYAKVFCRVNQTNEAFNSTAGQRFEIVPQIAFSDLANGKLIVRVLFDGNPIANLRVSNGCENVNGGKYLRHTRTDADGLAELKLESGGHWFVRTHYIRPHSDIENYEWESFWASLTFRF